MCYASPIPLGGPNLDNRSIARVSFAHLHYLIPRVFQHRWSYILETKPQIINIIDLFSLKFYKNVTKCSAGISKRQFNLSRNDGSHGRHSGKVAMLVIGILNQNFEFQIKKNSFFNFYFTANCCFYCYSDDYSTNLSHKSRTNNSNGSIAFRIYSHF